MDQSSFECGAVHFLLQGYQNENAEHSEILVDCMRMYSLYGVLLVAKVFSKGQLLHLQIDYVFNY